jgi:peptide-methionine (S)-S-oxide reductase
MRRTALVLAFATGLAVAHALAHATPAAAQDLRTAVVAGGCFWCVEADFDKVEGVVETLSGYTGGHVDNPTYEQVVTGTTGHYEAVRITFDADIISYRELIDIFWRTVDPTDPGGQFCDRGDSYRTAIFVADEAEREAAEASREAAEAALGEAIVTPVLDAATFWPAEDYHQDYYRTNPVRYAFYRAACGRDARIRSLWGEEAFMGLSGTGG